MNFKGFAWVGNVYKKFEAMCLEVEELIVQVKCCIEGQVQTVGNSMKKFCSDVVQDLLPDDTVVQVTRPPSIQKDSASLSIVHNTRVRNDVGAVKSSDSPPGEVARLNSKEECQKEIRTKNEHGLAVASSVRCQVSEIQPSVAMILPTGSDDCRKETDEDSMQTSSSSVPGQLSEKSVEESCIIVDGDELHCVFPDRKENDKRKPYKKILDAISSRMKQNRENEYKQLARQWYAEDVVNGRECVDKPKQIEEKRPLEESEWKLL
ncbi:hypothetical protein Bca4012_017485 [Brassica carinata]